MKRNRTWPVFLGSPTAELSRFWPLALTFGQHPVYSSRPAVTVAGITGRIAELDLPKWWNW
jgi:hypothetical protein